VFYDEPLVASTNLLDEGTGRRERTPGRDTISREHSDAVLSCLLSFRRFCLVYP
jgi:hypothetical protein